MLQCTLDFGPVYSIGSSLVSFFLPCAVMLTLYFQLFSIARRHAESIRVTACQPMLNLSNLSRDRPDPSGSGSHQYQREPGPPGKAHQQQADEVHQAPQGQAIPAHSPRTTPRPSLAPSLQKLDSGEDRAVQFASAVSLPLMKQLSCNSDPPTPGPLQGGCPGEALLLPGSQGSNPAGGNQLIVWSNSRVNLNNLKVREAATFNTDGPSRTGTGSADPPVNKAVGGNNLGRGHDGRQRHHRRHMFSSLKRSMVSPRGKTPSRDSPTITINRSAASESPLLQEHKAAITIGIIMGVFLLCWAPFFVINVVFGICKDCISPTTFKVLTWLGYSNSAFNPVIYSIFNAEFRQAFKRILTKDPKECSKGLFPSCLTNKYDSDVRRAENNSKRYYNHHITGYR